MAGLELELEHLHQEVRAVALELVRLELVQIRVSLNGHPPATNGATATPPATRVCVACGTEKPVSEFEPKRRECRACRRARARKTATAAGQEPAGPGSGARPTFDTSAG